MAISDYTGRTVDLFFMQGAETSGEQLIEMALGGSSGGQITTGIQKAAQTFLILFLTEKGSKRHDPDFGTRFVTRVRASGGRTSQVTVAFREAVEDVLTQQEKYRATNAENDEILNAITLVSFSAVSQTELQLIIQLTTIAGTSRQVIVPIRLAIR